MDTLDWIIIVLNSIVLSVNIAILLNSISRGDDFHIELMWIGLSALAISLMFAF